MSLVEDLPGFNCPSFTRLFRALKVMTQFRHYEENT